MTERSTDAELRVQLESRWDDLVAKDKPPELLDLVRAHGGHSSIPPAAWTEFDGKLKAWKARRRILERWPSYGGIA